MTNSSDRVDWSAALASTGDSRELLKEYVELSLEELPALMDRLRQAIEDRQLEHVQRFAHTVKGTARLFRVRRLEWLTEQFEEIDAAALEQEPGTLLAELQASVDQLLEALRQFLVIHRET